MGKSTPNVMIYGEISKNLLQVQIEKRLIVYWLKLINIEINQVKLLNKPMLHTEEYQLKILRSFLFICIIIVLLFYCYCY